MKVGASINTLNTIDWDRVNAKDWSRPPLRPDWEALNCTRRLGDLVEPLGFDSLWVSEHFGSPYGMVPNTLQFLAYRAARTQRIDLGTLVVVLPWWNPVKLAHELAFLDLLMDGRRFHFGVGRGVSRDEYEAIGVPQGESRQRFVETLDILKLALSKERFSYEGEIFTVPETSIRPRWRTPDIMDNVLGAFTTPESMQVAASRGLSHDLAGNAVNQAARLCAAAPAHDIRVWAAPSAPRAERARTRDRVLQSVLCRPSRP